MIVLDTNVLSEPLRTEPDQAVLSWLAHTAAEAAVTSITVGELLYGARRLPAGRRRDTLLVGIERLLDDAGGRLLPYDDRAARAYGELRATAETAGRAVSVEDGMIAAICVAHGARLATRNTRDFVGLDVEVVNPWLQA